MWRRLTRHPDDKDRRPTLFGRLTARFSRNKGAEIARLIAAHLAGEDQLPRLAPYRNAPETEAALTELLACVSGEARNRLSRLAADLGLAARWDRQARSGAAPRRREALSRLLELSWGVPDSTLMAALLDGDERIRIEAGRALLRSGGRRDLETVFDFVLSQQAEVRMALAPDLRPHALALAEQALPEALRSENPARVGAAIDLVEAWGKSLPLPDLAAALRHPDPPVRARAVRAIPHEAGLRGGEAEILRALADTAPEVRSAASIAAARLRLLSAVPSLLACLRDEATAPAAATALAEMGAEGLEALEREVRLAWEPATAAAALAAIERARSEGYGYARL